MNRNVWRSHGLCQLICCFSVDNVPCSWVFTDPSGLPSGVSCEHREGFSGFLRPERSQRFQALPSPWRHCLAWCLAAPGLAMTASHSCGTCFGDDTRGRFIWGCSDVTRGLTLRGPCLFSPGGPIRPQVTSPTGDPCTPFGPGSANRLGRREALPGLGFSLLCL